MFSILRTYFRGNWQSQGGVRSTTKCTLCEAKVPSKVLKIFDIRKRNHKKPTNSVEILTFIGQKIGKASFLDLHGMYIIPRRVPRQGC